MDVLFEDYQDILKTTPNPFKLVKLDPLILILKIY